MIYNFEQEYYEMLKKLKQCKKWGVQIADCRYRPLTQTFEHYNPRQKQTNEDYYIHPRWTDRQIKSLRRKVREQNIMVRHGFTFYSRKLERLGAKRKEAELLSKGIDNKNILKYTDEQIAGV